MGAIEFLTLLRKKFINRLDILRFAFNLRNKVLGYRPVQLRILGESLYLVPFGGEVFQAWSGLRLEREELEFFVTQLRSDSVVCDIGSNVGLFSLLASRKLSTIESQGKIFAFEPTPTTFELLQRNLKLNSVSNVAAIHTALGSYQGTATLYMNAQGLDALNSLGRPVRKDAQVIAEVEVPVVPLDLWLEQHGVDRVDIVKMDVEGAELLVLQGAARLLEQPNAPTIMFESDPLNTEGLGYHPSVIYQLLENSGYIVHLLSAGKLVTRPAHIYKGTMVAIKPQHQL